MARRNLREMLQHLLKRQQDAAKPAPVEPSYFNQDDKKAEGKPDDKRPARVSQGRSMTASDRPGNRRPEAAPAQTGDAKKGFDIATDAKRIKEQQEFDRRFTTPEARATALEVREEIQDAREDIERQYREDVQAARDVIKQLVNDRRPAPPDAARDANRKFLDLADARERDMARLDRLQAAAFAQLDVMNVKLVNWGPNRLRLGTTHETDPVADFNAAATPDITAHDNAPAEEVVIYVRPDAETVPDDPIESAPPVDWVAEFNKHARPPHDGPGIRP